MNTPTRSFSGSTNSLGAKSAAFQRFPDRKAAAIWLCCGEIPGFRFGERAVPMAVRGESLEEFSKSGLIPDMLKAALR
jgi:hypothetical protein